MLQIKAIDVAYQATSVLRHVSLEIAEGEVACLLGPNGAGKSTAVSSIVGFVPVKAGSITLDGVDITDLPIERRARLGLAVVPQGRRVFPLLTVEENLQIGGTRKSGPWSLQRIYDVFPRLDERKRSLAGHLSGGEQQMVAIGRALMSNPRMILMDEPSEGLAPIVIESVYRVIAQLAAAGMSILLVEHSLDLAIELGQRIYILGKGEIVWHTRTPSDLTDDVRARYLGVG